MKKPLVFLLALFSVSLCGYVAGVWILTVIVSHFPQVGPFVFVDTHGGSSFTLHGAALQPVSYMAVMALSLAFDAACLGLEQSSLKRLLDCSSKSARVDLFYTVLRLAGGFNVLVFLFSFGTLIWFVNQIHRVLHIAILGHVHSYLIQFAVVCLINTFISYWAHRLMHTRWMWEIHKVHHAAEEMNVITSFRNHPIEQLVMSVLNAVPVAMLGASPPVILAYTALSMVYGSLSHSEINLKSKLWNIILITPAGHRIHHSNRVEHFDSNFGILTLWDYLFGTYFVPSDEKLSYGVEDGETFNRSEYLRELLDNVRRWLAPAQAGRMETEPSEDESTIQPSVADGGTAAREIRTASIPLDSRQPQRAA